MILQRTTRYILINHLLKRNYYTKEAVVIGSTPDKSLPDYQVRHYRRQIIPLSNQDEFTEIVQENRMSDVEVNPKYALL
jgi:hypothetical protein